MNKEYLVSLATYQVVCGLIWLVLASLFGTFTMSNYVGTFMVGIVVHRFFVWKNGEK